jgi:hypothetical protein
MSNIAHSTRIEPNTSRKICNPESGDHEHIDDRGGDILCFCKQEKTSFSFFPYAVVHLTGTGACGTGQGLREKGVSSFYVSSPTMLDSTSSRSCVAFYASHLRAEGYVATTRIAS